MEFIQPLRKCYKSRKRTTWKKKGVRRRGMEQYNTDNLWLLTKSQHNKKTAIENKLSDQQLKNVGRDWWKKVLKNKKWEISITTLAFGKHLFWRS